jgi:hypothetical protein
VEGEPAEGAAVTPAAIYIAVRDAIILAVIGFVAWKVYELGGDQIKVKDFAAWQKQVTANTATVAGWQKELSDANAQRATELAQIHTDIAAHAQLPVYVVRSGPASASTLPSHPATPGCPAAASGGPDAGPGGHLVNVRPELDEFEQRYEVALANCRAALASWPTPEK